MDDRKGAAEYCAQTRSIDEVENYAEIANPKTNGCEVSYRHSGVDLFH